MNTIEKYLFKYLICPYCQSKFSSIFIYEGFGYIECECAEYPMVEGIVYIKKEDSLLNTRIVNSIKKKKYLTAIFQSLSGSQKMQSLVVVIWYFIFKKTGYLIPRKILLQTLMKVGGKAKNWYKYLLNRGYNSELMHAFQMAEKIPTNAFIVDIGTGVGHFFEIIKHLVNQKNLRYIGIDKNFLSLIIARIYNPDDKCILICVDVENGLPLISNMAHSIFYIDSFYQLYNSRRQIEESFRILKKQGTLGLLQLFENNSITQTWGYGISPNRISDLLSKKFLSITLINNQGTKIKQVSTNRINNYSYSCIAIKA